MLMIMYDAAITPVITKTVAAKVAVFAATAVIVVAAVVVVIPEVVGGGGVVVVVVSTLAVDSSATMLNHRVLCGL